jgi:hypothetical protein
LRFNYGAGSGASFIKAMLTRTSAEEELLKRNS